MELVFSVPVNKRLGKPGATRSSVHLRKGSIRGSEGGEKEFGYRALAVICSLLRFGDNPYFVLLYFGWSTNYSPGGGSCPGDFKRCRVYTIHFGWRSLVQ